MIVTMVLLSTATAIESGIISDVGSSIHSYESTPDTRFSAVTELTSSSLAKTVSGSGNFSDAHWVYNHRYDGVGIDVDIINSNSYNYGYDYHMAPGDADISIWENLDVDGAKEIHAHAKAKTSDSHTAGSEISILQGTLKGYSNKKPGSDGYSQRNVRKVS
jgi:hypothetical protein